ncbi:MAG TPA: DUF1559 domain-containing protein [Pirellulales bacterium]|nr:DUF1559 domain-containing protein [Pirellulales bacterium]
MMEPRPLQFGLKTILAITAGVALFFAAGSWFGPAGYVGICMVTVLGTALFYPRLAIVERVVMCLIVAILVALLLPAQATNCTGRRRSQCTNNLKQIGLALHNYNSAYGCFPPVCTTDENGKPMHSWRVLILPFMEQRELYDRYDFNEPWNGPHNALLANEMPPVFRCPNDTANPGANTDYVAVVGPETIWQPDQSTTFRDIEDGSSSTIAVIEASGAGIHWMEPRDLPFAALAKRVNPKPGPGISSMHPGAVLAVFADGHTQSIDEGISLEQLKALFTKAGGEAIDDDF